MTFYTRVTKHDWTEKARDKAADDGAAMSDGSFPIRSAKDIKDAIGLAHNSHHPFSAVKAHIRERAKKLKLTSALPAGW